SCLLGVEQSSRRDLAIIQVRFIIINNDSLRSLVENPEKRIFNDELFDMAKSALSWYQRHLYL
ncbi:4852_t:CDS:1, partial [Dentiscutata heterogama]